MWLLPSMNRPDQAQAVIDACTDMGMTQTAVLFVDGISVDGYLNIKLPQNWTIFIAGKRVGLTEAMNWALRQYPSEHCYGWLADDTYPETKNWCDIIEHQTGDWYFCNCYDRYIMDKNKKYYDIVSRGALMTSGLCWGGELIRSVGWWAYPQVIQVGIDWIWTELIKDSGIAKYLPDVTVRHDNYRTGRRPYDVTDDAVYKGYYKSDYFNAKQYIKSDSFKGLRKNIIRQFEAATNGI